MSNIKINSDPVTVAQRRPIPKRAIENGLSL